MLRYIYYFIPIVLAAHYGVSLTVCSDACKHLVPFLSPLFLFVLLHYTYLSLIHAPLNQPQVQSNDNEEQHFCKRCGILQSMTSKHCSICNRCVDGFDHHCDVLEMCIGRGNIGWFRAFLTGAAALCTYGAYEHAKLLKCTIRTPAIWAHLSYTALFVIEFAFAVSFSLFALFHLSLWACGTTTYRLIIKVRQWFSPRTNKKN